MAKQSEVGINMALRISPNMSWRRSLKYLVLSIPKNLVAGESEVGINMPLGGCFSSPRHHGRELKQASICRCT